VYNLKGIAYKTEKYGIKNQEKVYQTTGNRRLNKSNKSTETNAILTMATASAVAAASWVKGPL